MGRLYCCLLAITVLGVDHVLASCANAQPALPGAMRVWESKPVTVKDAQFVGVAQTDWRPCKQKSYLFVAPIDLQLRITNLGKTDVLFPTFGTFGVKIINADGKEIKPRTVRNGTTLTKPVLLTGGASYALCRCAELRWDENTKASNLSYYDGTGSQSVIGPLEPGRYKLVFWYTVLPDKQAKRKDGDPATWSGGVVTNEVPIEVLDGTTRGFLPAEQFLNAFTEPLRIHETKPKTVNDAKFVVVAESNWKPGKENVPIEIQLRITNLSKKDQIFPTFDTFGVIIKNEDGKQIMPRVGRDLTKFTVPVLITQGVSYSLCRKAELRWNASAKTTELFYWDGTGSEYAYGPLHSGRYKLSFVYGVSLREPLFKAWEKQHENMNGPSVWHGEVITEEVIIDVHNR